MFVFISLETVILKIFWLSVCKCWLIENWSVLCSFVKYSVQCDCLLGWYISKWSIPPPMIQHGTLLYICTFCCSWKFVILEHACWLIKQFVDSVCIVFKSCHGQTWFEGEEKKLQIDLKVEAVRVEELMTDSLKHDSMCSEATWNAV